MKLKILAMVALLAVLDTKVSAKSEQSREATDKPDKAVQPGQPHVSPGTFFVTVEVSEKGDMPAELVMPGKANQTGQPVEVDGSRAKHGDVRNGEVGYDDDNGKVLRNGKGVRDVNGDRNQDDSKPAESDRAVENSTKNNYEVSSETINFN